MFRILVEGRRQGQGCFVTFWVAGLKLGDALGRALDAARLRGIRQASACQADLCAVSDVPPEVTPVAPGVRQTVAIHCWTPRSGDIRFWVPTGVVHARGGPDDLVEGYRVHARPPWLEIVVDGRHLERTFFSLIDALPTADGLELRRIGARSTEVWLSGAHRTRRAIAAYLGHYRLDLLQNGFVEPAVYSRASHTTLRLTQHRTIEFQGDRRGDLRVVEARLGQLGFARRAHLASFAARHHHHHYRPRGALSGRDLARRLRRDGFRIVETLT